MARTKEFDPETALQAALELFWEHGYEATSMADLVERLGIARASIYATFGGKHDLYLRALDRYGEGSDTGLLHELSQPGPVLPVLRALVERLAEESASDSTRRGCFVTNTAVELAPHDIQAARRVEANLALMETALATALARAKAQGELDGGRDPHALARFLVTLVQGMRVMGRTAPDPPRLRAAAAQALALLE